MKKTENNNETPQKIFETAFGFMATRVLVTGVDLGIFTCIANGNHTTDEISRATSASPRGMEIILNALTSIGYLKKNEKKYELTTLSEKFLIKGKASYYGDFVQHIDNLWDSWGNLTMVTKNGTPVRRIEKDQGPEFFEQMVAQIFPMSYPCARAAAESLGVGSSWKKLKILDVASGSGAWGIAFAEKDNMTAVTALDYPNVLEVTRKIVAKFNLEKSFNYLAGDLKEIDFGKDNYDLIILGHICHSEGAARTKELLLRVQKALKEKCKVLIAEMIPDDERKSEVFPLMFAANMLINSSDGNTFTLKEFREWLENAGFSDMTTIEAQGPSPLIVATKNSCNGT